MMSVRRFVTLIMLMLACPAIVRGDEICYVPSLAISEQYNNNILLATDADNIRKDYITIPSLGFAMTDKTVRLDSLLSLQVQRLLYSRNEELDATNQHYNGSIRYSATPLLNVSAEAGYAKDSNPSLGSATSSSSLPPTHDSNTGGGNTSSSTTLPLIATPVESILASASMDYHMTETTSLSAMYQFGWSSYEIPQYRDTSHDAKAGLVIDLSKDLPRVNGRINTGYSQYLFPDSKTINVMGTIGFSYDISKAWTILVDGGMRRTDTEIFVNQLAPFGNQQQDYTETAGTGQLSLSYQGEYTGAELHYIQDFTMAYLASGHQTPAQRQALTFTARHQITGELSAVLVAGYTTYTTAHVLTQTNVTISPVIRYDLARMSGERDLALEASYEHTRIDYIASGTAYRDLFFILLTVRFPYCSSSQYK
ncbi:MAG TPA: hypothetical protein VL087_00745 [Nitrospirota bacterium]|nr:hypothetical protein [Nitrospirota bacterium]